MSNKGKTSGKYHRILEAAVKVFAKQGFHQSTVSQIAREAGVADGTIYLYFKNKDDILVQFFSYKARQVFSLFREEVDKADNTKDKLFSLIHRHLEEFQRDRDMAVVYQTVTHQKSLLAKDEIRDQIREMSKLYLDMVSEIVEKGQEEGSMRKDIYLGLVKRFILGAVDSVINNWLYSGAKYDLVSMSDPLIDLFIRGIGNPKKTDAK
ncbi:MAG: TetR family transcriptional regulator [Desulfobacteraceae bacterium 4572_88]|nr:MAG: TetR family transcriptional regulator [Desulfobacteraceae bacterium 4572_88]